MNESETSLAVVVRTDNAQVVRKLLEIHKFWDGNRKLVNSEGTVAIPVHRHNVAELVRFLQDFPEAEVKELSLPSSAKSARKTEGHKLKDAVRKLVRSRDMSDAFLQEVPRKWERHGDLVLLPSPAFSSPDWSVLGDELWETIASVLSCHRLAKLSSVSDNGFRTPQVSMLLGHDGKVVTTDNGIKYSFDVTKCMFSSGNITEKLRVASWDCSGETVVDLYAGIGYFTLPYLVHAKACHVHACEWNPDAVDALRETLALNGVEGRCTVHPGDNRQLQLSGVADRVNLGLIPSSEEGWCVAARVLKPAGGVLHIHHNVTTVSSTSNSDGKVCDGKVKDVRDCEHCCNRHSETGMDSDCAVGPDKKRARYIPWAMSVAHRIQALLEEEKAGEGGGWECHIGHIEKVKSYAPHIDHVVLDLTCRPKSL